MRCRTTYKIPTRKMPARPHFWPLGSCSFAIYGRGKASIRISVTIVGIAFP